MASVGQTVLAYRHVVFGSTGPVGSPWDPPLSAIGLFTSTYSLFGLIPFDRTRLWRTSTLVWLVWSLLYLALIVGFLVQSDERRINQLSEAFQVTQAQWLKFVLVRSVMLGFNLDNLFCFLYFNYIAGHRLCAHLEHIGGHSTGLMRLLVRATILGAILFNCLVTLCFNLLLARHYSSRQQLFGDVRRMILFALYLSPISLLSLFIYTMFLYRANIRHISEAEWDSLASLKAEIQRVHSHFRATNRILRLPVLVSVVCCTLIVMGTTCTLVTISGNPKAVASNGRFLVFAFLQSVIRLSLYLHTGGLAQWEFDSLLARVQHRVGRWSTLQWLHWKCIQAFHFRFTLYSVLTVDQTLLLSVSTFVLPYVALLVQTEKSTFLHHAPTD